MNPLADPLYLLPPLVGAGVNLALAVTVICLGRRRPVNRAFALFLGAISLWALFTFAMRSSPDPAHALFWEKFLLVGIFMAAPTWYLFCLRYTNARSGPLLWPAFLMWVVAAVLSSRGLLVRDMVLQSYGWEPVWGPAMLPMVAAIVTVAVAGARKLWGLYGSSTTYQERNRVLYIIIGMGFVGAGNLIDVALVLYPAGIFGNIVFGLATTVAIVRYRLLDIQIILRKSLAYGLATIGLGVPYVGVVFLANRLLMAQGVPLYVWLAILAVLALGFQLIWRSSQRVVDRWFYGERYEHLMELERFSQEAKSVTDLPWLAHALVDRVARAMRARQVHLMLPAGHGFAITASSGQNGREPLFLSREGALVRWLETRDNCLSRQDIATSPHLRGLTMNEFSLLHELDGELYVPLKRRDDLVGILIVGPSLSPSGYSQQDVSLLLLVATRIALTIHDAYLFAEQKTLAQEMERLSQLKSDFVAAVAHEFKTPLTAIKAASGLLGEENPQTSYALHRRVVASLSKNVERLERMVNDSLKLAAIQAATLEAKPEKVDVRQLVEETALAVSPVTRAKSQVIEVEVNGSLPPVMLDPGRFQDILFNLLGNAVKFTPQEGRIVLSVSYHNRNLMVEVRDQAPTIPVDQREAIFNPYYRLGVNGNRSEGTGLGLAIVKGLVEQQGGRIWVESPDETGNHFCFSLPLVIPAEEEVAATPLTEEGRGHESTGN